MQFEPGHNPFGVRFVDLKDPRLWFTILPMFGVGLGFVGCLVAAQLLKRFGMQHDYESSSTAYGQMFGLFSMPICVALGGAIGVAIALAGISRFGWATAVLLLTSVTCCVVVIHVWDGQIADYGRDPTDIIVYYPPLGFCAVAAAVMIGILAAGLIAARRLRIAADRC